MKLRKIQSVLLATSGLLMTGVPAAHAVEAAVGGVVRASSGMPQMGVLVALSRADSSVIQAVRTDDRGRYLIAGIMPGIYQLKAVETSFLPTLRENLHIGTRGRTEANLTLSTLMEALQWLPAHKRNEAEPEDDWTWTLRSAAYRPLLRFVGEDGLETIEGSHARRHHGRFLIESGARSFGNGGPSETVEYLRHDAHGETLQLRSEVGNSSQATTQFMAGYSHENGVGSGLSSALSYQLDPGISGLTGSGLHVLQLRTADTMKLGPDLTAEVGNQMEMVGIGASSTTFFLPFANVGWTFGSAANGSTTASYVLSTTPGLDNTAELTDQRSLVPLAVIRDGAIGMEHGLHQQLRLEHETESGSMKASVAVYRDRVRNPIVDGMVVDGIANGQQSGLSLASSLFDAQTQMTRVAGDDYETGGMVVEISRKGPASTRASLQFATGSALTAAALNDSAAQVRSIGPSPVFTAEHAQTVAMILEGASNATGTRWRSSYRWQPASTVNAVDLFDTGMAGAYLSLFLRQSLHLSHIVPGGVDAVVDVRNLLAQGYHPFLTSDGNQIFFAQADRSIQGGLAFYF